MSTITEVMHTELIHGCAAFSELASEWDDLVDCSMTATPFQRLGYQQAWWSNLGQGDLHTIAVREDGGELAAIACFYIIDGCLYFNGCTEETDYLDLITPAERAALAWDCVLDLLEGNNFPAWQGLNLCNIPAASASNHILRRQAEKRNYQFRSSVQEVCPVVTLPDTFDAYLMNLDRKNRHEIRRKRRRADAAAAEVVTVGPKDDLAEAVEEFLNLLQKSMPEKAEWLNDGRRAVFHEVAAASMAAGTLQLMFLTHRGSRAAALFTFDYKDRIWVYNSGFDIKNFGYLSPGVVLTAGAIEMAIEKGRTAFDFLRGDEKYKYQFGAEDTTIQRIQITRAS